MRIVEALRSLSKTGKTLECQRTSLLLTRRVHGYSHSIDVNDNTIAIQANVIPLVRYVGRSRRAAQPQSLLAPDEFYDHTKIATPQT